MLNRILPTRPRAGSRHSRSPSDYGASAPSTPQMDNETDSFDGTGSKERRRISSGMSAWGQKLSPRTLLAPPSVAPRHPDPETAGIPREMIPALTLLAAHGSRVYMEGYFMLLAELNAEGQPIPNPRWVEVFGTLQGTVITMWDAALLEEGRHDTSFINVGDGYMRSVETLGDNLQNIIVLSTTMKNRYLLQFGTKKLFNEWTAALRLSAFERTALQEAYTGALLSAKGAQLHGIRALLSQTKYKQETWCQVRFGVGMPWRHVWVVITPNNEIRDKKERRRYAPLGKMELFNDPRDIKKKKHPIATIERVSAAFAVFPEKSVLVDVSTLVKLEGFVVFENEVEPRETSIFLMPDPHPGIDGYETLIRFLIPVLDVFALYGRPHRLNADKNDINSLLFGMPTLPRAHYLDVIDVYMLATLADSPQWSASEWNNRIKELIARKLAMGFRGTGSVSRSGSSPLSGSDTSSLRTMQQRKPRAISDPHVAKLFATPSPNDTSTTAASSTSSLNNNNKHAPVVPSPLQHSRPAPKAPTAQVPSQEPSQPSMPPPPVQVYPQPSGYATDASSSIAASRRTPGPTGQLPNSSVPTITTEPSAPRGPRPGPGDMLDPDPSGSKHIRVKSEGGDRIPGLLTPQLGDDSLDTENSPPRESPRSSQSRPTLNSADSFASATDGGDNQLDFGLNDSQGPNLFDPTYRPAHQSYADYSEYMKQYLNRSLGSGDAISTSLPTQVEEKASEPTTPRATSNGGAKLLDTPIRTPELSVGGTPTAAEESASRLRDSPPSDALDSLALPKPVSGVGAQRKPSGPRPDPTQSPQQQSIPRKPAPGEQTRAPVPNALRADSPVSLDGMAAIRGPPPNNSHPNPYMPSGMHPYQNNPPQGGYGAGPGGLPNGAPKQTFPGQGGMPPSDNFGFPIPGPRGPPNPRGSPGPGGPRPAGPGMQGPLPPQMRMRVPAPGTYGAPNPYAQPSFGGPLGGYNGPMPPPGHVGPPAGYGGPPAPVLGAPPQGYGGPFQIPGPPSPSLQDGSSGPMPQGSAKTGPPLRPRNEIRAQQLRDTRAHAKNNGGYPSFH